MSIELPLVTVVMANYNYSKWIKQAINSVKNQDYPNKRLVLVQDGEHEESQQIIMELFNECYTPTSHPFEKLYIGKYEEMPLTVIGYKESKGPGIARSIAVQASFKDSHMFAVIDSDDYWEPTKLSKSVGLMISDPEHIGCVYSDNFILNEETGLVTREFRESFNRQRLLHHNMIHSSMLINRLAFERVGLWDQNLSYFAEDLDMSLMISEYFIILHIPEPLMTHRVHGQNISGNITDRQRQAWSYIATKHKARTQKKQ